MEDDVETIRKLQSANRALTQGMTTLGQNEAQLRAIFEQLEEGLVIFDPEGGILYWNRAALTMLDLQGTEHGAESWSAFSDLFEVGTAGNVPVPAADWPWARIGRGERVSQWELTLKRRDAGWRKTISHSGTAVENPGAKRVAFLTLTDVTAREGADLALEATQQQLELLISQSPAVVFTLAAAGDKVVPVVRGGYVQKLLGISEAEAAKAAWYEEMLHPADKHRVVRNWASAISVGRGAAEFRLRHRDGSYRWIKEIIKAVNSAEGAFRYGIGTWVDITERKRAEEVLSAPREEKRRRHHSTAARDTKLLGGLALIVFGLASVFDLFETPLEIVLKNKETSLDELFGTAIVLSPIFALFAYRRWNESRQAFLKPLEGASLSPTSARGVSRRIFTDLLGIMIFAIVIFSLALYFKGFEPLVDWVWLHRGGVADEVFGTLIFLTPAFVAFAYRRWQETRTEIDRHEQTAMALKVLHAELDQRVQLRTSELAATNESLQNEIIERGRAERRVKLQQVVAAALAEATTQAQGSKRVLQTICKEMAWDFGEFWRIDASDSVLRCSEVSHVSAALAGMANANRDATLGRGIGGPGRVWASGKVEWLVELPQENASLRDVLIWKSGLVSWVGIPVVMRRQVVGVLGFFSTTPQPVEHEMEQTLSMIGEQHGQFIERLLLAEQFRQAQKMDAIGTLAAGIAHDFNNIIASISGSADLLKMTRTSDPESREAVEAIAISARRAAALVRQILAFSRQEKNVLRPVQLETVAREALKLLRATIPSSILFKTKFDEDLPPVLADINQLHQVMLNLCTNAAQAMARKPGTLSVAVERCDVEEEHTRMNPGLKPGLYVRLAISDTGHGMSETTRTKIFDPFFTTKAQGEGVGLGLAVVHGIVEAHGGVIAVESKVNEGASFFLYFPVTEAPLALPRAAADEARRGSGERILYVDDEELLAQTAQRLLRRMGYVVDTRTSPAEALALFSQNPGAYHLVITDMAMPEINGTELAQAILRVRPELPIILITGYTSPETLKRAKEVGIRELLMKPATVENLTTAIQRAVGAGQG